MRFSEKELTAIDEFIETHLSSSKLNCYRNNNSNHNSLGFDIKLRWTGIGVTTFITCNCCGEIKDVTDYGCW